jgi:hypothetical protein
MTDTDNDSCDWRDDVRDCYFEVDQKPEEFIADIERLLTEYRAMSLAYDSVVEFGSTGYRHDPADTWDIVFDVRNRAEDLARLLRRKPRVISYLAQGALLAEVEDLSTRMEALVIAANQALVEFGPPPRRGSSRQSPRLMFVAGVARAYVGNLGESSATPENCLRDSIFQDVMEQILTEAGIPASNPARLLAQAFPKP